MSFLLGFFVGGLVGVIGFALLVAAGRSDEKMTVVDATIDVGNPVRYGATIVIGGRSLRPGDSVEWVADGIVVARLVYDDPDDYETVVTV